jgi:RNA polymerase sigma-70 factor (ECF subfamily)
VDGLIDQVGELLVRFLTARLGSPEAAADVAQDAYVRMLSLEDPDRVQNPRSFLFRTAVNLAVDRARRDRRERSFLAESVSERDATGSGREWTEHSPEGDLRARERAREISAALAELPSSCREAFLMHRFEGLPYGEIAQRLGVSKSMVEKHLIRALEHLRQRLRQEQG